MLQLFTINTTAEIICFVMAVICLINDKSAIWRVLVLFLFITCATEMSAIPIKKRYIADPVHVLSNAWLYNILFIFQALFFSLMFNYLLQKYRNSKFIIASGLALLAVLYVYEIFLHGIFNYNNLSNTVMAVLLVLYSLFYYYSLHNDELFLNLKFDANFWWVTGLLFFYFGDTACNLFYEKIKVVLPANKHYLGYIYNVLNIILYSCWSYSFICRKWLTPMMSKA